MIHMTVRSKYIRADQEMIDKAISICYFHASADIVEAWVKKLRDLSGQNIDWGYSCGIANVFFIGNHHKVYRAALKLKAQLNKICIDDSFEKYGLKILHIPAWRLFSPPTTPWYDNIISSMFRYYYKP